MYTREDLIADVKKEAEALRVHATKEEIARLSFKRLDPEGTRNCIYGQMTFDCNSDRGVELIGICAHRYIKDPNLTNIAQEGFGRIQARVNGSKVEGFKRNRQGFATTHYSAIEAYILLPDAKNANLIAFLKNETEMLEL